MDFLFDPQIWASFLTLTALEIVLGIDNIIFLSIATQGLPADKAKRARSIGLTGALGLRLVLLGSIVWIASLIEPIVTIYGHEISWRDVILGAGGMFLLTKGTFEIHDSVEGSHEGGARPPAKFFMVVIQIMVLDIVFSLDSVVTAVGMAQEFGVMAAAVVVAVIVMAIASKPVGDFVQKHPTVKMLALSFLLLVGMALVADAAHFHVPRGYLYFAIAFSAGVETLNLLASDRRNRRKAAGKL